MSIFLGTGASEGIPAAFAVVLIVNVHGIEVEKIFALAVHF